MTTHSDAETHISTEGADNALQRLTLEPESTVDATHFRFLDLPLELRQRVYQFVLQPPSLDRYFPDCGPVQTCCPLRRPVNRPFTRAFTAGLLRVNKQLHEETEVELYTKFDFFFQHICDFDQFQAFIMHLNPRCVAMIRSMRLYCAFFVEGRLDCFMACSIEEQKEAWMLLKGKLEFLNTVTLAFDLRQHYVNEPEDPDLERLGESVAELCSVFDGIEAITLMTQAHDEHRAVVLEACKKSLMERLTRTDVKTQLLEVSGRTERQLEQAPQP